MLKVTRSEIVLRLWFRAHGSRSAWEYGHALKDWDYGFGHGCSGHRVNGITAWAWMGLLFGNGCSGHRMLVEHERDYGLANRNHRVVTGTS